MFLLIEFGESGIDGKDLRERPESSRFHSGMPSRRDEKLSMGYSDEYSPYLFIMTIKSFIFDAARVCGTRDRPAENLRAAASPMRIHARSAFPGFLAPCHGARRFGLPRFSSAASGWCGYPSVLGSIPLLLPLLDPRSPASARRWRRLFF